MVYILPLKWHMRALYSSQALSNKAINNMLKNDNDLKWICDVSLGIFGVLHMSFKFVNIWILRWGNFV